MSPALMPMLVAIATLGVALAALIVGLFAWIRSDMRRMEDRLVSRSESDMRGLEARLVSRIEQGEAQLVSRIEQGEARLVSRIEQGEARLVSRIEQVETRLVHVETRLTAVEHSQAKLEGLLEGLREAIVARAA